MENVTRRSFVSGAAAGATALGLLGGAARAAEGQLVWKTSDWKPAEFQALVKNPARIKQVYDVVEIAGGNFLTHVKNSLNGLEYGFGLPRGQIKIAAAMHGPANLLNYDDYIWNKYQIGEWMKVTDPATGKPAASNIFYKSKAVSENGPASVDPNNEASVYQDVSMQTLQARGVQFLSCHTATEMQARALIRLRKLPLAPEEVVQEMLAHTVPGVMVVAAMVAAIALLQAEGRFTYITI